MHTFYKNPDKDFVILNITDTQLGDEEWEEDHIHYKIFIYTMNELLKRVKPDLITVTGDITWSHCAYAHKRFADYMDSLDIPWAPIWGNHDCDIPGVREGKEKVLLESKNCLYEIGDRKFGSGNYVIRINEGERTVESLIMVDSHDREKVILDDGTEHDDWAKLYPEQIEWIRDTALSENNECSVFLHIPIYAYRTAFDEAFRGDMYSPEEVKPEESSDEKYWRIQGCTGVKYEGICSYPLDDGAMPEIEKAGNIRYMFCGHDHVNNFMVPYHGVNLCYAMKTGAACYWKDNVSGGTVIRISSEGIKEVKHEYVDYFKENN